MYLGDDDLRLCVIEGEAEAFAIDVETLKGHRGAILSSW